MNKHEVRSILVLTTLVLFAACGGGDKRESETAEYSFGVEPDVAFENPEGSRQLDWCPYGQRDDIAAIDMNLDGINDIISVFRCYRDTNDGWWYTEVHDEDMPAAWIIWLSQPDGSFRESTGDLVGENYLDVTDGSTGGIVAGAVGVLPFDVNRDGYPDLVYNMSRDDTRVQDLDGVLDPDPLHTWESRQSIVMSRGDGTYERQLIGKRFPAGSHSLFPNRAGTYDFVVIGYGETQIHRYMNGTWIDVAGEWDDMRNWTTIKNGGTYWSLINPTGDSSEGGFTTEPTHLIQDGFSQGNGPITANGLQYPGVTLYEMTADGFELADTWVADSEPLVFRQRCDFCPNGWSEARAYYWDGQITFNMAWETHHVVRLYKNQPPVIIVQALGHALHQNYRNDRLDPDTIYNPAPPPFGHAPNYLVAAHILKALQYEAGELVPVALNPLPEGIMREGAFHFVFRDVNGDEYDDLIVQSHTSYTPVVWLNNHAGQFVRIRNDVYPPTRVGIDGYIAITEGYGLWYGAKAGLKDFNGDGLLDLVAWHWGWDGNTSNWPPAYADDARWQSGDIVIHFATKLLSIEENGMRVEEIWELDANR